VRCPGNEFVSTHQRHGRRENLSDGHEENSEIKNSVHYRKFRNKGRAEGGDGGGPN